MTHALAITLLLTAAEAPAPKAGPQGPQIQRLIQQLGSDSYAEREAAAKALTEIGEPALEALREAAKSKDAEVRRRAAELVEHIVGPTLAIRVVHTWGDLLRQPAIDVGHGVRVRLGIGARNCPRWSGTFLYAYAEGYDDWQPQLVNRDRLGPLWLSVQREGHSLDADERYPLVSSGRPLDETERTNGLLFARPVMIDKPGRYTIAVRTNDGEVVGTATLRGTEDPDRPFHPWAPLLLLADAEHERIGDEYKFRRTAPAVATNLDRGIALPHLMGDMGSPVDPRLDRVKKLPALLPEIVGGMKLSIDQRSLLIRVVPDERITTSRPDWHFLARWWVNGKPFLPRPILPIPRKDGAMVMYSDEDVAVRLKVDAKKLGARAGDRVDLQLLYCPSGWLPVENPQEGEKGGEHGFPVLTNRVSFRIP
jgi:hypothetical protein